MPTAMAQIAADVKTYMRKIKQKSLKRNVAVADMPPDDIDVLCTYFPVQFICEVFGGNFQLVLQGHNSRMKEKEAERRQAEFEGDESRRVPKEPAGIGNWRYADRLKEKVLISLESVLSQGVGTAGHNQFVQAAKELLAQSQKMKVDAAEVMGAYESQLLCLSEHIVDQFLPKLGQIIKEELHSEAESALAYILEHSSPDEQTVLMIETALSKMTRGVELKRFELLLAESMAKNQDVCEAFDFSKDLIENYKHTEGVEIQNKSSVLLKTHIQQRT